MGYFNPVEIILLLGLCSPNTLQESTKEVLEKLNDLCLSIRRFKFEVVLKEMPEECFTKLQTMHHMKLLVEWCVDIHSHSSTTFGFGQWSVPMVFFSLQEENMSVETGFPTLDCAGTAVTKEWRNKALQRIGAFLKGLICTLVPTCVAPTVWEDGDFGTAEQLVRSLTSIETVDEKTLQTQKKFWTCIDQAQQSGESVSTRSCWAMFKAKVLC